MGVSRALFPNIHIFGDPAVHRLLAALALTVAVIHGGMHGYFRAKNKKKAVILIVLFAGVSLYIGLGLVPYLNRHFATQGSHGFASSTGDIKSIMGDTSVVEGISVYCDDIPKARKLLYDWLAESGLGRTD